jgi:hypothetical protein
VSVTEAVAVRTGARRPGAGTDDPPGGTRGDADAPGVEAGTSA